MKTILLSLFMLVLVGAGCATPTNSVEVSGLTFTLPSEWTVVSSEDDQVLIQIPDPQYNIVVPFEVKEYTGNVSGLTLIKETASGAKLYGEACAPTLGCVYIQHKDKMYLAVFLMATSDEVPPENLDGVWFPNANVTREQMTDVFASVK